MVDDDEDTASDDELCFIVAMAVFLVFSVYFYLGCVINQSHQCP